MVGNPESKWLEVAALNLFHPTTSPISRKVAFSYYDTVSRGEGRVRGHLTVVAEKEKLTSWRLSFDKNLSLIVNYVKR